LLAFVCLAVPAAAGAKIDSISINPVVTGTLGSNGWYVSNVHVVWEFTPAPDNTQGCDIKTITAEGKTHLDCKAWWGSVSVDYPLDLYIDKTPPAVGSVAAEHGNRSVMLRWAASADTQVFQVTRRGGGSSGKLIYRGTAHAVKDKRLRVGKKYEYSVTAFDEAANQATATIAVKATGSLTYPVPGQTVTSRTHLTWLSVKGASYYNVQLVRGGRILSKWPTRTSVNLRRSWVYHGHRYHLRRGVYRWYVWPGFGRRAQTHYGKLLGSSSFVYAP
jgi:hypothetical protein